MSLKVPKKEELEHDLKIEELEAGYIGKFIGKGEESKKNIAFILSLFLVISGMIASATNFDKSIDFWKTIIVPIITFVLGYLLSKK